MYRSLSQAAADDHRDALRAEATHDRLVALAACCARSWTRGRQRVAAWLRDLVRTTQLGPGYQPPLHQGLERHRGSYFQPCCA